MGRVIKSKQGVKTMAKAKSKVRTVKAWAVVDRFDAGSGFSEDDNITVFWERYQAQTEKQARGRNVNGSGYKVIPITIKGKW